MRARNPQPLPEAFSAAPANAVSGRLNNPVRGGEVKCERFERAAAKSG
jgi:hypothetical protein